MILTILVSYEIPFPRSTEDRCVPIANLKPRIENWYIKALISEKTPIRLKWVNLQQKYVFIDKQCTTFEPHLRQLGKELQLFHTYSIGNGTIKEIPKSTALLVDLDHQIILTKNAYIKLANKEEQLSLEEVYDVTRFEELPSLMDTNEKLS
ncbi:OLC1v1024334C1 [Oldenlandia corymbosa var. corymbosa]|uniref:OLC1v1024334C1 n=1 Tax=Oldenlandia corymbosa var. corymbosa TaxID=529605 RepID=A0AAV1C208_OLDCO|nr:OLC1v1024334C1 [Oldenlandia corymbosa var. corymbosa]